MSNKVDIALASTPGMVSIVIPQQEYLLLVNLVSQAE